MAKNTRKSNEIACTANFLFTLNKAGRANLKNGSNLEEGLWNRVDLLTSARSARSERATLRKSRNRAPLYVCAMLPSPARRSHDESAKKFLRALLLERSIDYKYYTHFVFFSNFRPVVGKVYVFKRSHNEEQLIGIDLLWNRRAFWNSNLWIRPCLSERSLLTEEPQESN